MPKLLNPNSLFVIGLSILDKNRGKGVAFNKFIVIIKGNKAGKTKLDHKSSPFFTEFIISFGKIIIIRLKNTIKIVIM